MQQDKFVSTTKAAQILGVNRIQVFRLIKSGKIPAIKIGRNFIIKLSDLGIFNEELTPQTERDVDKTVKRVFKEYGNVIKKLGEE